MRARIRLDPASFILFIFLSRRRTRVERNVWYMGRGGNFRFQGLTRVSSVVE